MGLNRKYDFPMVTVNTELRMDLTERFAAVCIEASDRNGFFELISISLKTMKFQLMVSIPKVEFQWLESKESFLKSRLIHLFHNCRLAKGCLHAIISLQTQQFDEDGSCEIMGIDLT